MFVRAVTLLLVAVVIYAVFSGGWPSFTDLVDGFNDIGDRTLSLGLLGTAAIFAAVVQLVTRR
ncbi:MAG: hypothetical protein S0880_28725 [Actinomycetota bacterium]|nr:hypothetical protein [Actinomycetota bacterium]